MMLVVFRSRLRPQVDLEALGALGARMHALATQMPGFVSYKDYASEDGESVTVVLFESESTLLAWREHPEHREAQRLGRERYFASYEVHVAQVTRSSSHTAPTSS